MLDNIELLPADLCATAHADPGDHDQIHQQDAQHIKERLVGRPCQL
jgi:hypothetical protein